MPQRKALLQQAYVELAAHGGFIAAEAKLIISHITMCDLLTIRSDVVKQPDVAEYLCGVDKLIDEHSVQGRRCQLRDLAEPMSKIPAQMHNSPDEPGAGGTSTPQSRASVIRVPSSGPKKSGPPASLSLTNNGDLTLDFIDGLPPKLDCDADKCRTQIDPGHHEIDLNCTERVCKWVQQPITLKLDAEAGVAYCLYALSDHSGPGFSAYDGGYRKPRVSRCD